MLKVSTTWVRRSSDEAYGRAFLRALGTGAGSRHNHLHRPRGGAVTRQKVVPVFTITAEMARRITRLIGEIRRDPFEGGELLACYWSRRIDDEHLLVTGPTRRK